MTDAETDTEAGSVLAETMASVERARRDGLITETDRGSVATLYSLARKIDAADLYFDALLRRSEDAKSRPPAPDNVSHAVYRQYANDLGLTAMGRAAIAAKIPVKAPEDPKESGRKATVTLLSGMRKDAAR